MPLDASARARLRGAVSGTIREDRASLDAVASDASGVPGRPDVVVRPEGVEDLVRLVAWATETGVPLVPRGAGSSLDGESAATGGGVVVDFSGWTRILEIDPVDGVARVEPGVVNRTLDRALRPHGRTYPVNPGSGAISTLGGNAGTNASGPRSYRHGPTRAWVRELEVVDGRGRRWRAGGRWAKASIGPDPLGLLVGSEGTLGLFAEITLRVARCPERRTGLVVPIPREVRLGGFVGELAEALGPDGSALEYVDAATAASLGDTARSDWPGDSALLLAEIEGSAGSEEAALARVAALAERRGVVGRVAVYPDSERLWEIRGAAGPALQRSWGPGLREDVAVPPSRLDELLEGIGRIAEAHGVEVRCFGHVGQGNLHPVFGVAPHGEAGGRVAAELAELTRGLGGAISGEHGIGTMKRRALEGQLPPPAMALLRAVKGELDPRGILNPGKLLP